MQIYYSKKFEREYKKLPKEIKRVAEEKETMFREDPFDKKLDTHKLHGRYQDYWAFTVIGQYRIMFTFAEKDTIDFINIGTHEIYK